MKTGNHFWLYIYEDIFLRFLHTTKKIISLSSFLKLDFKKNLQKIIDQKESLSTHIYIVMDRLNKFRFFSFGKPNREIG